MREIETGKDMGERETHTDRDRGRKKVRQTDRTKQKERGEK